MGSVVLIGLVVLGVYVVVLLLVRRPIQARLFADTGAIEWRATARGLSRRDRWTLYWATSLGRPTSPRLAALAVQRADAMARAIERTTRKGSKFVKLFVLVGIFGVVDLAIGITQLAMGDRGFSVWSSLVSAAVMMGFGFGWRRLQTLQAKAVMRSRARNQALSGP